MPERGATIVQLLHALTVGGAEVLAARLARRLRDEYRFVFVCLDGLGELGEQLRGAGFPVHVLGRRPGLDWRCPLRLARVLGRERADLVHAHQYTPFFYGLMGRLLCRRPPVLFTEHGRWLPDIRRPRRILANRLLVERRDRIVGVGKSVRQALIRNEGLPARRVGVVYNGIDVHAFGDTRHDRPAVRREIGLGPHDLAILQVARLDHLKDHATAVRALARVARERPEARLVLIGEGPERAKIEACVREYKLAGRVVFLGLRRDVARLLAAADLFLLTSISEGIPLTVLEAMAAGLPVVSTRVGGVPEIVADGQTGLLAPAGDDEALAAVILQLAGNENLRRQLGDAGRERARTRFSEERMVGEYARIYEEMLHGRTGA
jgi:sugar transferase (PEP-CTERM/EpsH1 system associated)